MEVIEFNLKKRNDNNPNLINALNTSINHPLYGNYSIAPINSTSSLKLKNLIYIKCMY